MTIPGALGKFVAEGRVDVGGDDDRSHANRVDQRQVTRRQEVTQNTDGSVSVDNGR